MMVSGRATTPHPKAAEAAGFVGQVAGYGHRGLEEGVAGSGCLGGACSGVRGKAPALQVGGGGSGDVDQLLCRVTGHARSGTREKVTLVISGTWSVRPLGARMRASAACGVVSAKAAADKGVGAPGVTMPASLTMPAAHTLSVDGS